ncbi:precorrin-3B synthase [Streptomyces sp. NPDC058662]|uniref:precorrin-3B synthase n=1 Tax=Streptomyces sp. NPDC058662 TaxID=3346583 RepID=UPI00365402ED
MPQPPSAASRDEPVIRERGDACPGALRLHAADDGYLARVRIPGGELSSHQASVLGLAADRFGDGHLELTSRGNVQVRGLGEGCGAGLAELLHAAGLLPAPSHERVRNIVATPLSGEPDPVRPEAASVRPDVMPWVRELDRLLCAGARVAALSGRFLFAFDDGRGDVVALGADVTVLGRQDGGALVRLGAASGAVAVGGTDAPAAALLAAEYFLDAAEAAGTRAWRVRELPDGHALDEEEFRARLAAAGIAAERVPAVRWPYAPAPMPWGTGTGTGAEGRMPLCVLPPLGRLSTGQWQALVQVAEQGGRGMRVTPWRTVVIPNAPVTGPFDGPARLRAAGLVVDPDGPWQGVTACTGRPGCAKALADVRADASAVVEAARGALPVHWSGCERRCGHPQGTAWVDLVATGSGYGLSVHGRAVAYETGLAAALAAARELRSPSDEADEADEVDAVAVPEAPSVDAVKK